MRQRNWFLSLVALAIGLVFISGCKRDEDEEPAPTDTSFNVRLEFHVDGVPLEFDTMKYQTEAGYPYSVDRLQFYLSAFEFERNDGSKVTSDEVVYVDVFESKGILFKLTKIPQGTYKSATFLVGLDSLHNITGALENNLDNMNMAWPTQMGGGYHFMKFEGNYFSGGSSYGFAMHMGKNQHLVQTGVTKNMTISSASDTLKLKMNLNEWFKNPHVYDFDVDGSGSMYNDAAMMKLKENGADVYNEQPGPVDPSFNVRLEFNVDGVPLQFNTTIYQTEAGYSYSIDRLQFYLSNFEFERFNGSKVFSNEWVYVDVLDEKGIVFKLTQIPQGTYKSATFLVGLDSLHNITNALPNNIDNINMAWPTMMGGGYHFMKFEGNYISGGSPYGFAMHLGKNQHLVQTGVTKNMAISSASDTLKLKMNLNEWFKNPHIYDFDVDGSSSMYNDAAMFKLKENGADVYNE